MIARKLKNSLLLTFIFFSIFSYAQKGNFEAKIKPSARSGYYKIKLSPELRALSNSDLSDIRILDYFGKQVPYYIEYSQPKTISKTEKIIFKDIKQIKTKKQSQFIISNTFKRQIDYLSLTINNTNVSKQFSIEGSNDNQNWYSVVDKEILSDLYDNSATKIEKTIYLPKTNYAFYKLTINDSNSSPIVISEISNYDNSQQNESAKIQIKDFKLTYLKQGNDNLIEFNSNYKYKIDELTINTKNKELFDRRISILTETKIKKRTQSQVVYESHITNNNSNFTGLNLTESKFKIEILNGDNQPLDIRLIELYQYPIYLIAELDSTQNYTISSGDKSATAPNYDIVNFKDKIPVDLTVLDIGNITTKIPIGDKISIEKTKRIQKWFMWSCLALGVVVVFYISIYMINSMNKNTV